MVGSRLVLGLDVTLRTPSRAAASWPNPPLGELDDQRICPTRFPKERVAPVRGTPDMFYATPDLGVATSNISSCSGAAPEGAPVQPEGPHCGHSSTSVQRRQCFG
jgi:hypothetical protein